MPGNCVSPRPRFFGCARRELLPEGELACVFIRVSRNIAKVQNEIRALQAQNQNIGEFSERTDRLAEKLGLPLRELGDRIGVSTAMLFAYRSGKNPISVKAWKKLEQAELESGIGAPPSTPLADRRDGGQISESQLESEIRQLLDEAIGAARGDVARMGWIREQILQHLEIPEHWDIHERVLKEVLEEERQRAKSAS